MADDNGAAPVVKTCHRSMSGTQSPCLGEECSAWLTAQRPVGNNQMLQFTGCLDVLASIDAGIQSGAAIQSLQHRAQVVPMPSLPNIRGGH